MSKPHEPQYISCREAQKRLFVARGHILKLAAAGKIGMRKGLGVAKPRFSAADVERLRRQAIVPAKNHVSEPAVD